MFMLVLLLFLCVSCNGNDIQETEVVDGVESSESVDLPGYTRVKQELVAPPLVPVHDQAYAGPRIVEVELVAEEKLMQISDSESFWAMTFNGSIPGPIIVVHQDDYVELTLVNPTSNMMGHNIDFHAATGALGGGAVTNVAPGEKTVLRFKATRPGVFVYHCAHGGGEPNTFHEIPFHVITGMSGVIMVLPKDGLKDRDGNRLKYDKAVYVSVQDLYIPKGKTYSSVAESMSDVLKLSKSLSPTHLVFNGAVGALRGNNALKSSVGETVLIVHGQVNRAVDAHLIGGHGDYVWSHGSFNNPPLQDLETWNIPAGAAAAALYTFRQPGTYAYLPHSLIEALQYDAVAHFKVEGEWNDDLMTPAPGQVKPHTH